jgi:hypothetical protein
MAYAMEGKVFQAAFRNLNYACCHVYGGTTYAKDWKCFTNLANVVLVPRSLKSLTDHHTDVINTLKQISFIKYGWKPEGYNLLIDDGVRNLEKKTKEVGIPLNLFDQIWRDEVEKHRQSFREKFQKEPDF